MNNNKDITAHVADVMADLQGKSSSNPDNTNPYLANIKYINREKTRDQLQTYSGDHHYGDA